MNSYIVHLIIMGTKTHSRKKTIYHHELLKNEGMLFGSEIHKIQNITQELPSIYADPKAPIVHHRSISTTQTSGLTHLFWVEFTGTNHYLKEYSCKTIYKQLSGLSVFISTLSVSAWFTVTEQYK